MSCAIIADSKLPKSFKISKIIAVLKLDKEPERVNSYCQIALLNECYKAAKEML